MTTDWETLFGQWAQAPGKTEQERCDNAVSAVRNAVARSPQLRERSIKVFTQGSYRNRVNVRHDSDVDIGVLCDDVFLDTYPEGTTRETFGNVAASYTYAQYKMDLEEALVGYFGNGA